MAVLNNSEMIERCLRDLRMLGHNSAQQNAIELTAHAIDVYRAEVAKEIEGLKGDVKAAEAAYEREKVRADGLAQEQDRWTNEQLPGWRKRVGETEDKLRRMTMAKDEWKVDSEAREANEINLRNQIAFLKQWVQDLQAEQKVEYSVDTGFTPMTPGEFSEKFFGVDPGAPEGDKTVITFECCNVKHFFSPPKFGNWNHQAECQECGSLTTFTSAN